MMMAKPSDPASPLCLEGVNVFHTLTRNCIIKEGYLVKRGHIRHNWRTRWFVLNRSCLKYFKRREDSHPKGQISLVGASLDCPPFHSSSKRQWLLKLTTVEGREYMIQAPDQITRSEWQLAIEERIRKLDPSKLEVKKRKSPVSKKKVMVTLRRSFLSAANEEEISTQRDIVQAMQDPSAGVKLQEIKRGKHIDKCFKGKDAVDWIISWYFASTREEAIQLAGSMLRNGFFHAIEEASGKFAKSMLAAEKGKYYEFQDQEYSRYIFVNFSPVQTVELFPGSDDEDDDDWLVEIDNDESSSPEIDCATKRTLSLDSVDSLSDHENEEDRIIRQGFLLKKGHIRKSWKIRRFVLTEKSTHLCYYKIQKNKGRPQGAIPLLDCTISIIDKDSSSSSSSTPDSTPSPNTRAKSLPLRLNSSSGRPYMFCLETSNGIKYCIQAASEEERSGWISDISTKIVSLKECQMRSGSVLV